MTTTEYVTELEDADGDIAESEYWPTVSEALAYRSRLMSEGEPVERIKVARVTNHWDRNDRDNLLSRDYKYLG